jgi:AraC-like DNA-binding protein
MRTPGLFLLRPADIRATEHAILYISQNYKDPITAAFLSGHFGISITKLNTAIRLKTNMSLHEYHQKVRIENAIRLLPDQSLNIKQIGHLVGFNSPSHFVKVFKQMAGATPRQVRLKVKANT